MSEVVAVGGTAMEAVEEVGEVLLITETEE
jgi:hypothetical protein